MKKSVVFAAIALGAAAAVSAQNPCIGNWELVMENGESKSGFQKTYWHNGRFNVDQKTGENKMPGSKVTYHTAVQRGSWTAGADGVIVEHCEMGDKGDVTITNTIVGDTLIQKFSYANPDVVYVQKYVKSGNVEMLTDVTELVIPGVGSFGGNFDRTVFIIDGKHLGKDDFSALKSEEIERFNVIKDSSAANYLTAEEIAAGKSDVIVVTLKKK